MLELDSLSLGVIICESEAYRSESAFSEGLLSFLKMIAEVGVLPPSKACSIFSPSVGLSPSLVFGSAWGGRLGG